MDGLIATGQAVGMIYYATASDATFRGTPFSRGGAVALDGVAAGLFVASAIYGGTQVSDCREAYPHDVEPVVERRSRRRPPPPPLWTPPPPPLWTPPPAPAVSAPTPADAGTSDGAPTPDADVVAPPPPPPRPAAPPVRQRADDE
ncbi:MAG TPA: hypothetical protein VK989_16815 [Polyangia bacterium]|nr:hypothetical protein [Polyangia bacterium]